MTSTAALVLVGGPFGAASGCKVLTSGTLSDDVVFDGAPDGGPTTTSCSACLANECLAPWAVCLLDDRCRAIHLCSSGVGCGGAECKTSCFCANPGDDAGTFGGVRPQGAYVALASCDQTRTCNACRSDCATSCENAAPPATPRSCGLAEDAGGGVEDAAIASDASADGAIDAGPDRGGEDGGDASTAPEGPSADRCATCGSSKCGDPKKACAIGSECASYLACAHACADAACVEDCGRRHATGKVAAVELATCTAASCKEACGF